MAKPGDARTRTLTGLLLAALASVAVWMGGYPFAALVAATAVLVLREWRVLLRLRQWHYLAALLALAASLAIILVDVRVQGLQLATGLVLAGSLVLALIGGPAALGLAYAGLPAVALLWLRALPFGFEVVVWIFAVVIATDVFAYIAGRLIGGRKLAPRISPGKTWSGLAGGVAAGFAAGWFVASAFALPLWLGLSGGMAALLAQTGDLFESWLKRRAGVKDSGSLLPGHGGVMDRVDGFLPVAVATAIAIFVGMGG